MKEDDVSMLMFVLRSKFKNDICDSSLKTANEFIWKFNA